MMYTDHAKSRMRQRGIPSHVVNLLLDYGVSTRAHEHASIFFFNKKSKSKIKKDIGVRAFQKIESKLDIYIIEREGRMVTVGHRYKRIKRDI